MKGAGNSTWEKPEDLMRRAVEEQRKKGGVSG